MGAVAWAMRQRSISHPLIEPDVPVSGIRLSDRSHRKAHPSHYFLTSEHLLSLNGCAASSAGMRRRTL